MQDIHGEIVGDLNEKVSDPKSTLGLSPAAQAVVLDAIPSAVKGILDLMVSVGGDSLRSLVVANRATVKAYVSDRVLTYVIGICQDIEALPKAGE